MVKLRISSASRYSTYEDLYPTEQKEEEETTLFGNGNPFWLLGAYAPIGQKSFLKTSKNSEKNFLPCI
jgi:hypothetical protein